MAGEELQGFALVECICGDHFGRDPTAKCPQDQGPGALADGEEAPAHRSGEPGSTSQVLPGRPAARLRESRFLGTERLETCF